VPHLLRSTSPVPVISAVPGAPPFVVLQPYFGGDSAPSRVVVQAAGTRHVLGFVPAPHGTHWESVAATGSSTAFLAAAGSRGSNCAIRLYTLTLTASGKPAGLRPLNAPKIPGQLTSLAASANLWVPITPSQSLSWCLLLEEGSSSEVSGCERRISRRVVRVVFRGLPVLNPAVPERCCGSS
jgi:hypothetical protein